MINVTTTSIPPAYSIRTAGQRDEDAVARVAALDSSAVPSAPLLLGTIDGVPAAALSLATGAIVADPFQRTAALADLLRLRATHLQDPVHPPGRARLRVRLALVTRRRRAVA